MTWLDSYVAKHQDQVAVEADRQDVELLQR